MQAAMTEEPTIAPAGELARAFEDHHSLVFGTAYRITGNAADAEDVLQTIFLRLLRREQRDRMEDQKSYLRRAAVNVSLDLVRSRRDERAADLVGIPSGAKDHDGGELKEALRRALGRLAPRSAEVFALRFFEGFSNQEIAGMLGMSSVLVAVIVHRARRQLQRDLGNYR